MLNKGSCGYGSFSNPSTKRTDFCPVVGVLAIAHSGEHYGQLVVYYRANNLVPTGHAALTKELPFAVANRAKPYR